MTYIKNYNELNSALKKLPLKFAIQHKPTGMYIFDDAINAEINGRQDFGSTFLIDNPEMIFIDKQMAVNAITELTHKGTILFEDDSEYPKHEFEIVEIN